ncbi:MAG TPA: 2'-5' RNA ligase [Cyanobacteria bacterium UBA8803]|nr:2'-5' RNA ligase [Cyanobacteria bacterium UBA8803]
MKRLFFIALLPPQQIQDCTNEIKEYFAQVYSSRGAQTSPPHITLQPPFEWQLDELPTLEQSLRTFTESQSPVPIILKGFGAFVPRVIYINVIKTPELIAVQSSLAAYLETSLGIVHPDSQRRPYSPHITGAYKDLTKQNFRAAWPEFEHRPLEFNFTVSQLTLLVHENHQWYVRAEFPFGRNEE